MCKCTPNIRTPFCGKPGCEWPSQKPEGARLPDAPVSPERLDELIQLWREFGADRNHVSALSELKALREHNALNLSMLRELVEEAEDYIGYDTGFPFEEATKKARAFLNGLSPLPLQPRSASVD